MEKKRKGKSAFTVIGSVRQKLELSLIQEVLNTRNSSSPRAMCPSKCCHSWKKVVPYLASSSFK